MKDHFDDKCFLQNTQYFVVPDIPEYSGSAACLSAGRWKAGQRQTPPINFPNKATSGILQPSKGNLLRFISDRHASHWQNNAPLFLILCLDDPDNKCESMIKLDHFKKSPAKGMRNQSFMLHPSDDDGGMGIELLCHRDHVLFRSIESLGHVGLFFL